MLPIVPHTKQGLIIVRPYYCYCYQYCDYRCRSFPSPSPPLLLPFSSSPSPPLLFPFSSPSPPPLPFPPPPIMILLLIKQHNDVYNEILFNDSISQDSFHGK